MPLLMPKSSQQKRGSSSYKENRPKRLIKHDTPSWRQLLLVAALVIEQKPYGHILRHALDVSMVVRRFWLFKQCGINTYLMPYSPIYLDAIDTVREIWYTDRLKFESLCAEARSTLYESVQYRLLEEPYRQSYRYVARKYLYNACYNHGVKPVRGTLERLTGWADKSAFIPEEIIPWADFESGKFQLPEENP